MAAADYTTQQRDLIEQVQETLRQHSELLSSGRVDFGEQRELIKLATSFYVHRVCSWGRRSGRRRSIQVQLHKVPRLPTAAPAQTRPQTRPRAAAQTPRQEWGCAKRKRAHRSGDLEALWTPQPAKKSAWTHACLGNPYPLRASEFRTVITSCPVAKATLHEAPSCASGATRSRSISYPGK